MRAGCQDGNLFIHNEFLINESLIIQPYKTALYTGFCAHPKHVSSLNRNPSSMCFYMAPTTLESMFHKSYLDAF